MCLGVAMSRVAHPRSIDVFPPRAPRLVLEIVDDREDVGWVWSA